MTTPMTEDTPLMGPRSTYQGDDVEHQGDASFEEVQDIDRARVSKSRLLLAMISLLAGAAVACFSTGLIGDLSAKKIYAWKWGGHKNHQETNYTGIIEERVAELEELLSELNATMVKAKHEAEKKLKSEEAMLKSWHNATLAREEDWMKSKASHLLSRHEDALEENLHNEWSQEIDAIEFRKEILQEYISTLKEEESDSEMGDGMGYEEIGGSESKVNITELIEKSEEELSALNANETKIKSNGQSEIHVKEKYMEAQEKTSLQARLKALEARGKDIYANAKANLVQEMNYTLSAELDDLHSEEEDIIEELKKLKKILNDSDTPDQKKSKTKVQEDNKLTPPEETKEASKLTPPEETKEASKPPDVHNQTSVRL